MFTYDTNAVLVTDSARVWGFSEDLYSGSTAAAYDEAFLCPATATSAKLFLSPVGSERTPNTWAAYAESAFAIGRPKEVVAPTLTPSTLINGTPGAQASKTSGGRFSLGLACTSNNGATVVGAFYRTINMTAVTGAFTIEAQSDVVVTPTSTPTPVPTEMTGSVALAPSITAAKNGALSLSVQAGAAATFSAPSLVNNKSTTLGTLGAVTVVDDRVVTRNGWDLSANVADFVNSADATSTISKVQLGLAPSVTPAGTAATGVTAAAAQVAGSASYPAAFASGAAANTVGNSVLNAGLTFVAPQEKAAGTYTSTLTLTVVSK
ncbi:hypothetical protein E3O44_16355 [Cryobacterium algoricola]|uniref:WxL domain-containing protein n=1 Tax=Cryobacterium algoricola TaxID=1259183 RepID=A0ABY2I8A7_9MICO|nr:hypothetical protein [Cryobacterium algoricola]TFB84058.1 hypothetical protein E3O44_16355 [Cryobacterium algoricola]